MDAEIAYAAGSGLSYWAFDVYPESMMLSCALKYYLNSTRKQDVRFALILQVPWLAYPSPELIDVQLRRFVSYFRDPAYQTVLDGRPLVFWLGLSDQSVAVWGGWERFRVIVAEGLAVHAAAAGLPRPYSILLESDNFVPIMVRMRGSLDGVSAYALPGGTEAGRPFAELQAATVDFWSRVLRSGYDLLQPLPLGWDPRPRYYNPPPWLPHGEGLEHYVQATPRQVFEAVERAQRWAVQNANYTRTRHVLIYAWNEHDEGGWIQPTLFEGAARLDAIRWAIGPERISSPARVCRAKACRLGLAR